MKIKLAILEKDITYLQRMVSVFNNKYADKLEIYSFTEADTAIQTVESTKINVFLAGDEYEIATEKLPERCAFAYFVDGTDIQEFRGCPAICKFQKADVLYKQILRLYAEVASDIVTTVGEEGKCKVIGFLSPAGGTGSSTVAAACAMALTRRGKKVLYLNLEKYGSTKVFFPEAGQEGLSDVLYAIKSQKANFSLKLEGIINQDKSGVYFLPECKVALDRLEMTKEELSVLLRQVKLSETYEYVVLDMDFSFEEIEMEAMKQATVVVMVSNGSKAANHKVEQAYQSMEILEQQGKGISVDKLMLLYNHFHSDTGEVLQGIEIPLLGGINTYKGTNERQVAEAISNMNVFEKLL